MSEQERIDFEQQLKEDASLAKMLEEAQLTNEAIYFASLGELKNTIAADIKNIKYDEGGTNNTYRTAIIALLLVIISGGIITMYMTDQATEIITEEKIRNNEVVAIPKKSETEINNIHFDSIKNTPSEKQKTNVVEEKLNQNASTVDKKESNKTPLTTVLSQVDIDSKANDLPKENNTVTTPVEDTKPDLTMKPERKSSEQKSTEVCDKKFDVKVEHTCKHSDNGSIRILTDELLKYDFSVNEYSSSGSSGIFYNLASGEYKIKVRYYTTCSFEHKVTIDKKWCPQNPSFSFNPDYHEKWEINYEQGDEGVFIIYDRLGKEVYKSQLGSGNDTWGGTDAYGILVPVGTYIAFIHYSDGRKEKVELTVIR